MRLTSFARRTAAVTAATALISSGGAVTGLLEGVAFASNTVTGVSPTSADNRSTVVNVTATADTVGTLLPGDSLVLRPVDVQPWTSATYADHEVGDITSASGTLAPDGLSLTASFNLVRTPPGRYDVLAKHANNTMTPDNPLAFLKIFDYGDANVTTVGYGPDASGGSCQLPSDPCARGAGALDITGSNFARGADVQFLKTDGTTPDAGITFTPGNPGNTNGTGYPTTTLIQGNYAPAPDSTPGTPAFVPGKHFLRVVNTHPSTVPAKDHGTTVEFWQPWFAFESVTTDAGAGNAAVIGAGASGVTLTVKGRGFRPGSKLGVQGHSYNPLTPCDDISVGTATVTAIDPAKNNGNDSQISAPISAAACTDTSAARAVTVTGPESASWTRAAVLTVKVPPKVDAKSFATFGQGANHYAGLSVVETSITGTGFDFTATPSPTTCPQFDFGAGTTTTTLTCGSPNSATVKIDVAPGVIPGKYGVKVTNPSDGGSSTTAANSNAVPPYAPLTVTAGPTISTVSPTSFQPGQSKTVTVTGKDFSSSMTVLLQDPKHLDQAYPGITVGTVTVTQTGSTKVPPTTDATATFTVSVAANAPFDRPALVLVNPDHGTAVCLTCIGVDSLSVTPTADGNNGPTILTFSGTPMSGQHMADLVGPNTTITLARTVPADGQGVIAATAGSIAKDATCVNLADPTSPCVKAGFDLTEVAPGAYDATFVADSTNGSSLKWTCTGCFTIVGSTLVFTAITPSSGGAGATNVSVKVTGANFSRGMTLTVDSLSVHDVVFHPTSGGTPAYLTAQLDIPSDAATGGHDVTIAPADGANPQTKTNGFTVNAAPAPASIAPTSFGQGAHVTADGKALTVTVTGTSFGASGTTLDLGPGVTTSNVAVTKCTAVGGTCIPGSSDSLTATVVVSPTAATGARDVVVHNTDGGTGTLAGGFTVNVGPKVLSVNDETGAPALRPDGQQHTLTIVGSGFSTDNTNKPVVAVDPADKITLGTVTVVSASQLTVPVTVAADAVRGARGISVTNPGDRGYGACAATPTPCAFVAVEPGSPASLTLTSGARSLVASWTAPASDGGAPITSYRIAYTPQGGTTPTTVDVPASPRTYTISGLTNGLTYGVSVVAVNGVGKSAPRSATGVAGIAASVSLKGSATKVVWGSKLAFLGTLRGINGAPLTYRSVVLYFFPSAGSVKYYTRTVTTNSTGAFGYVMDWRYDSPYNSKVRAYFLGDSTTYRLSNSAYVGYGVSTRVLKTSPASYSKSSASTVLKISGTVTPNKKGAPIYLYRVVNGGLQWYSKTYVTSSSTYTFAVKPAKGTYTFLVYIPNTVGNIAGYSAKFTLYRV